MFENRKHKLISTAKFKTRLLKYFLYSIAMLSFSLGIGMIGYKYLGDLNWTDAFLNASMILAGMGPVDMMKTEASKIFSGFYALFSGIAFLTTAAVLLAPIAHRFMHILQIDDGE